PGWDAIDSRLKEVYGAQQPRHWGTLIKAMLGGPDPIDGISAYESQAGGISHLHFCTYGYSELYYNEEAVGKNFSGFGFEMTFRLASPLPPKEEPGWVLNLLQNLARYVFESGNRFGEYHWIPANGPIRLEYETDIVGLAFALDPELPSIESPHGMVEFIQAFGITSTELASLKSKSRSCEQIIEEQRRLNRMLVTDLARRDG
ncbi:MAG TPA: suppressor of fused domain protein, partial [Pyrinomonadaceae bacterium]